MPKNVSVEEINEIIEEFGVEYLLDEHMNPEDAKDSRVRTVLRAVRKNLNLLFRLVGLDEIKPLVTEDSVDEDMDVVDDDPADLETEPDPEDLSEMGS